MSNNKELTPVESLEAVYKFGAKCYKKGYQKACLELLAGIGLSSTLIIGPLLYNWLMDKNKEA